MLDIVVSLQSQVPAYEQIKSRIKALIMSGELSAGELLPSVRGLARDLKVSNITTIRAYADLENEGLITTVQGRGCFVNQLPEEIIKGQYLAEIEANLCDIAAKGKAAGLTLSELKSKLEEVYNASKCD
jgi:GntR family transcriptional regulator